MSRRGGYNSNWQNASNPNMAPLPPRPPRGGIGSGGYSGPPPGMGGMSPNASASPVGLPNHPGLPAMPAASSAAPAEAATTLFVGSISPGISDGWLTRLLETCGNIRTLKRVSKAFGFAEYYEPDAVLRAINALNGRELPPMGSEARSGEAKKLVVKADEKTKRFLEQYETTRIATAADEKNDSAAASAVESVIRQMMTSADADDDGASRPAYEVPAHLKDLPPEELPEEHRGSVLSEIEQFRQAAAAREETTRRRELELEKQRAAERARRAGVQPQQSSSNGRGYEGAPSYQKPVSFVPSSQDAGARSEADMDPEERDELEEKRRRERKEADAKAAAAEAERMYLSKERQRLAFWEKEAERDRREKERSEKDAIALLRKWEDWREDVAMEKELFYTDRKRWRHYRSQYRKKEEEADERDRVAEVEEAERAKKETERFLAQQAADMAAMAEQQRASGVLMPQEGGLSAPLKLNITNVAKADGASETTAAPPRVAGTAVLGDVDDDDLGKRASKIKQIDFSDVLTDEEREAQRKARFSKLEGSVPSDTESLFKLQPKWEWIDESLIQGKYKQWADKQIEESLGEQVEELVEFIVENLLGHKAADEFIAGIEPVLAEEAESFVAKLWRLLVLDSLAAAAGI